MTNQEYFDIVSKGLLEQREQARHSETKGPVQLDQYGNRCAVGIAFPPEQLQVDETGIFHLKTKLLAMGVSNELIDTCARMHDYCPVEQWPNRLRRIAEDFDLAFDD